MQGKKSKLYINVYKVIFFIHNYLDFGVKFDLDISFLDGFHLL